MKGKSRVLAILLAVIMVFTLMPTEWASAESQKKNNEEQGCEMVAQMDMYVDSTGNVTVKNQKGKLLPKAKVASKAKAVKSKPDTPNYDYNITGFSCEMIEQNRIMAQWDNFANSEEATYNVVIENVNTEKTYEFTCKQSEFKYKLEPGEYVIEIEANCTVDGQNYWDKQYFETTVQDMDIKNFHVKALNQKSIKLTWNKKSGVDGYEIWRYNYYTEEYFKRATINGNRSSYIDTNLYKNNLYTYKIRSFEISGGEKIYSTFTYIDSDVTGVGATNFIFKRAYTNSVYLRWNTLDRASGYEIYRYNGSSYKKIKTVTSKNTNTYVDKKLKRGTKYSYKVRAYRYINSKKYYGPMSDVSRITTFLHPRIHLQAYFYYNRYRDSYYMALTNKSNYSVRILPNATLWDDDSFTTGTYFRLKSYAYPNGSTFHQASTVTIKPHQKLRLYFKSLEGDVFYDEYSVFHFEYIMDGAKAYGNIGHDYRFRIGYYKKGEPTRN